MTLVVHRASPSAIAVLSGIGRYFPEWPAVLPSEEDPVLKPLAIGIDKDLTDRMVIPDDVSAEEAARQVRYAIGYLVRSFNYRRAVAVPGAMRHDADGRPVAPVTPAQSEFARARLPGYVKPKPAVKASSPQASHETRETITVKIPALKISVPLAPDQLKPIGEATKSVDLTLDMGDGQPFVVAFSGKNYRKALRQVDELRSSGAEVVVLLQGRLVSGHRVEAAGLSVQTRAPKGAS